jgi:hypothetical protein
VILNDQLEEGVMLEVGNVQNTSNGEHVTNPTHYGISDWIKGTASIKIADDDAAVAIIRHSHRAEISNIKKDTNNSSTATTPSQMMRDFCIAISEKVAQMRKLFEQTASSHFSVRNIIKNMEDQTEEIRSDVESSGYSVYSDTSELLASLKKEIEAINSFKGFLIGVHNKIEGFTEQAEFSLAQIQDVEKNMAQRNATLEIGMFSLARIREKALKALRCQDDLEPERVLLLLKDVRRRSIDEQAAESPGQNVSTQESKKA